MSSLFNIAAGGSTDFYGFEIQNSLRFDDGDNQRLEKTPSGAGSTTTWTWSAWVKRGDLQNVTLWSANSNSNQILINSNKMYFESNSTANNFIVSNKLLRDTSSWYNLVFVWDTTNSTQADRMRMFCNGVRITSFSSSSLPTQNRASVFNTAIQHEIGRRVNPDGLNFDGYMAEVNFIDGQALDASSFGETKSGVWIPKDTSGLTYGTNGYRLQFKQTGTGTASSSTIGADTSGQSNHYTSQNLNAFDVMPDSPTNNFPTLNAQIGSALSSYVDPRHGNLEVDTSNGGRGTTFSTMAMPTGTGEKYYAEYRYRADSGHMRVGIISVDQANQYLETNNFDSPTTDNVSYTSVTGKIAVNGAQQEVVATYTVGDVIGMAVDLENGTIQFSKNGSNVGSAVSQSFISSNEMLFAAGDSSTSQDIRYSANFGQDSTFAGDETAATNADTNGIGAFHSAVPSGFKALCAKNLPDPSISPSNDELPEDYFEANLWTGNGSSQSISSYEFSPDWVWIKERSSTSSHYLVDTIRGNTLFMQSNSTTQDTTNTVNVTSFDSNGFSLGSGGSTNESSQTYVGWAWLAGGTPTATNSEAAGAAPTSGSVMINGSASTANLAGTIAAKKISANTEAGFSIVQYEGTGSNATIAHGLSSAPEWVIHKRIETDGTNWANFHVFLGNTQFVNLNTTAAITASTSMFNSTSPTSTVISVGTSSHTNSSSKDYIAYCFHPIAGYSKFGRYEGNGSTDGAYVYLGFRPAFLIVKQFDASNRWIMYDNKRGSTNEADTTVINNNPLEEKLELNPNDDADEGTSGTDCFDFYSNGFKLRRSGDVYNGSGHDYIYMAFSEMPFKYANAK